jgi:hypothetical protein
LWTGLGCDFEFIAGASVMLFSFHSTCFRFTFPNQPTARF